MFFGRKEELQILQKRYDSPKFEFGYIYGQRRIGKTVLINEFQKGKNSLIFFANDSDDISIKKDFAKTFSDNTGRFRPNYEDWEDFFQDVADYFEDQKGLLVIDEYPNIIIGRDKKRKKTDFVSKLQYAIDYLFKNTQILIILTGSNVSFIENEIKDTNAPLYKRHTFDLMISKLDWPDAVEMLNGMSSEDKIKMLCLTDTYPFYLSHVDTSKNFEENLHGFFFNRDSIFVNDPSTLITSDIVTSGFYASIMRLISEGYNTISDLAKKLDTETGKVSTYMEELFKIKAVSKKTKFNSSRNVTYKITDRMCDFFLRFIFANVEMIKLGYGNSIEKEFEYKIDEFVHRSFEDLCITYLEYLNKNMKTETFVREFQNYKVENSKLGRSIELDIVASNNDTLLVGECKLSKNKKSIHIYEDMLEDTSVPPFNSFVNKYYYIFSSSGFVDSFGKKKIKNLRLIDANIMLNTKFD